MNKAVFLDRDGVINFERGDYCRNINDFIVNDGILQSIKLFRNNNYLVIVITNQGGIAKSLYTISDVLKMHKHLQDRLDKLNAQITDIYFCPHHDSISKCLCRKPDSLLFEKAIAYYDVDVSKSYMIGDSERDIIAAQKVGVKGILVKSNENIRLICSKIINADE